MYSQFRKKNQFVILFVDLQATLPAWNKKVPMKAEIWGVLLDYKFSMYFIVFRVF